MCNLRFGEQANNIEHLILFNYELAQKLAADRIAIAPNSIGSDTIA